MRPLHTDMGKWNYQKTKNIFFLILSHANQISFLNPFFRYFFYFLRSLGRRDQPFRMVTFSLHLSLVPLRNIVLIVPCPLLVYRYEPIVSTLYEWTE